MSDERTKKIRDRAHALWEQAGRPEGQDAEHWSQAEREVVAEDEAQPAAPEKGTARRGRKPKAAVDEVSVDAPKARRGRPAKATSDETAGVQEVATRAVRGRKPKAMIEEGAEAPKATRGRKPKSTADETTESAGDTGNRTSRTAAGAESDAPKAKRGRKPKVVAEGSDAAG